MRRVELFTPLEPAQTAIAQCVAPLLPILSESCELTIWTEQPEVSPAIEGRYRVRRLDRRRLGEPDQRPDPGALKIYQIGNHPDFHGGIFRVARRHPGVLVLHDLRLQNLMIPLLGMNDGALTREEYIEAMERHYGPAGGEEALRALSDPARLIEASRRFPLSELALERATAVVAHTDELAERLGGDPERPVLRLELPYAAPAWDGSDRARRRREDGRLRLVAFGFFGRNRRVPDLFAALAALPAGVRERFHLDLVGPAPEYLGLETEAARLGVAGQVRFHGYVADAVLDAILDQADLAVNLRNPSMGEASYSLLRAWSRALPAIVTDTAWYATLPEGVALRVPAEPELAIPAIRQRLLELAEDPAPFDELGRRARAHLVRKHSPVEYVRRLLELAESSCP